MKSIATIVAVVLLGVGMMLAGCQKKQHHHTTSGPASIPASSPATR